GTALLIGALVGTEREKRKSAEAEAGIGGLRTFVLMALLGAIAGWFANALHMPALLIAVLLIVGAAVLAGYVLAARVQPDSLGITTESAALTVCLLGAMTTLGYRDLAVALSFARQSREDSRRTTAYALASGVLLAWCIMFGRVIAEVLVVNRALLVRVLIPFAMMGATAAISAWMSFRRGASATDSTAAK